MLKSRGAMVWQLGVLGLGEGLLLAVPAVIAGPFLALGVVKLLGVIFFELSGASDALAGVPTGISIEAFLLGLAGGGLAVLVFTVATVAAARRSGIEAQTGRSAASHRQLASSLLPRPGPPRRDWTGVVAASEPGYFPGTVPGKPRVDH